MDPTHFSNFKPTQPKRIKNTVTWIKSPLHMEVEFDSRAPPPPPRETALWQSPPPLDFEICGNRPHGINLINRAAPL